jgi:hypothetical protein
MKRACNLFVLTVLIAFPVTLLFGLVTCPYAPYHEDGGQFFDKRNQPVSAEGYLRFEIWQSALIVACIPFASLAVGNTVCHYRRTGSFYIRADENCTFWTFWTQLTESFCRSRHDSRKDSPNPSADRPEIRRQQQGRP